MKQKSRLFTGYDLQKYAPVFLMLVLMLITTAVMLFAMIRYFIIFLRLLQNRKKTV